MNREALILSIYVSELSAGIQVSCVLCGDHLRFKFKCRDFFFVLFFFLLGMNALECCVVFSDLFESFLGEVPSKDGVVID